MTRLFLAAAAAVVLPSMVAAQSGYTPERVYETAHKQFADFESMLADLARADVVLLGEEHDSANSHRLELAVLEGLARRRGEIILSLEMFERDIQEPFEHFQMGHMSEDEFLSSARPWPRYATDYKPLVDFAIAHNWSIVAANAPRMFASDVARNGLDALKGKSDADRLFVAKDLRCGASGAYYKRFAEAMGGHPAQPPAAPKPAAAQTAPGAPPATAPAAGAMSAGAMPTVEHMYEAQCLKDETMAESIAQAYVGRASRGARPLVVHVTGAFHAEFGQGTIDRTRRRLPDKRVLAVSLMPVDNLDAVAPDAGDRKRSEYLVYTLK